jgi:hypothetical protein
MEGGKLFVDRVALKPNRLIAFLSARQLPSAIEHGTCITVLTPDELRSLLCVALQDWIDFLFVPSPKPFVLYADHDRYVTFLANTRSNLNKITMPLTAIGCEPVPGYVRKR